MCAEIRCKHICVAFNDHILYEKLVSKYTQLALEITTDRLSGLVKLGEHDGAQEKPSEVHKRNIPHGPVEQHFGLRPNRLVSNRGGIEVHPNPL